jgi:hypothetical protein
VAKRIITMGGTPSKDKTSGQLQRMTVQGRLPDAHGRMVSFTIGDIIHDVPLPDITNPGKTRAVSIFKYSDDYMRRNGPALAITNNVYPPTVANQDFDFIVLEHGKLPSVLADSIPKGRNADILQHFPGMQNYKQCKHDIERLNALCNIGGTAIGSITILGHDSRHSPNNFDLLPLNDRLIDVISSINPDEITSDVVKELRSTGIDEGSLCVNITGRQTSFSVLAQDEYSEKVYNLKLTGDDAYIQATLCDAAHSAGINGKYQNRVHTNSETGKSALVTEYAYSDMMIKEDGSAQVTNHLPMFNLPLTDFLGESDRMNPTYSAIATAIDGMMINSTEAKASLARSMLFNHAVHATNVNIGDIRCVVKSIEADLLTGRHFELVPLCFGLTADPEAGNSMQINISHGFYNGQVRTDHNGMLPFSNALETARIIAAELNMPVDEAMKAFNDAKAGILSLPDHAAGHEMASEMFESLASAVELSWGADMAATLRDDFQTRLDMQAVQENDQSLHSTSQLTETNTGRNR